MQRDPTDPRTWLARARSNLARAALGRQDPAIFFEDLCFDAQQAVEKALKAIFVLRQIDFPKTHSLATLMNLLEAAGIGVPEHIRAAEPLSNYAVGPRYPAVGPDVSEDEYRGALELARTVVGWAEGLANAELETGGEDSPS